MNRENKRYAHIPMPRKYLVEMVMDRRAACMVYQGKAYHDGAALAYFERSIERERMHINTQMQLRYILTMLRDQGEKETFRYLKEEVLAGNPFPWEEKD